MVMAPQTPKFFWEVQDVPIDPTEIIKWLVQLCHGFFEPYVIYTEIAYLTYNVKFRRAWPDSRFQKILKFFHLVKSLGPNEWENSQKPCNLALLANPLM